MRMVDGSGLARHNYISPDFFCRFLKAMSQSRSSAQYLSTLSVAGGSRMKNCPDSLRRRVRMKSGSMNGVLCYSGYILPAGGVSSRGSFSEDTIVFSIMTNNIVEDPAAVCNFIDALLVKLCNG